MQIFKYFFWSPSCVFFLLFTKFSSHIFLLNIVLVVQGNSPFQDTVLSHSTRMQRHNLRSIPLALSYLSRVTDQSIEPEATLLMIQSPNLRHSCQLKFVDPSNWSSWFNMLHSSINRINQRLLVQCNRVLPKILGGNHLSTFGWIVEKVRMSIWDIIFGFYFFKVLVVGLANWALNKGSC